MTVDGKITTRTFSPIDFTSRADKQHLFRQRALGDAVLIGHSTLKRDNVRLGIANSSLREVSGDAAQLVEPTDVRSIADGLVRLVGDGSAHARAELRERGLAQAARFSWPSAALQTRRLYDQVVGTG